MVTVTRSHNLSSDYVQYLPSQTTCQVGWPGGGQSTGPECIYPTALCITEMSTVMKGNTIIKYGIPNQDDITISIYNTIGSCVWKTNQRVPSPGYYNQKIDVGELSIGVYFVVLTQDREKISNKFILVK